MEMIRVCKMGADANNCGGTKQSCDNCVFKSSCDYMWLYKLWDDHDREYHGMGLLSQPIPIIVKDEMRHNRMITYGEDKDNFCYYSYSKKNNYIVIHDIYVHKTAEGKGYARKLINYLQEYYDTDIFAKCVRDSTAEKFWKHVGVQIQPSMNIDPFDMYEHRVSKDGKPKRDIGWYMIYNPNKKQTKVELW